MVAQGHPDEPQTGSMLLAAHHVDASFGAVSVRPLSSIRPTLNVDVIGEGSVTIEPLQADYAYGQEVTLTANPAPGHALGRWSGDLSGRQSPLTFAITKDMDITANFVVEQYASLTVNVVGGGAVTRQPEQTQYLIGEEVILTAVPNEDQLFTLWTGGLSGSQNPATLLIQGNTTVSAFFTPKPRYTLTVNTLGSGVVTREPNKADYFEGEVVKLTATPAVGFQFDSWIGDVTGSQNPVYVTMDRNKSVIANFVEGSAHTLTVNVVGNGRVLIEPDKPLYAYGEAVKLTAVADPGYMLGSWSGDWGGNSSPVVVYMLRDLSVTATFVEAINPRSDDFNRCVLDNGRWTTFDPVGDSSFTMTGTQLLISMPEGVNHNLWQDANFSENNAPRLLTPADNLDFEVEAKFTSRVQEQFQLQGILIQQDSDNFLRFDFYHDGANVRLFAAKFVNGLATPMYNEVIPDGATPHLRVRRVGNQWTQFYSYDGLTWTRGADFPHALTVSAAGLFAGNSGDNPPAFTAAVDYFFNTAMPIVPQDANQNRITVDTNGSGSVQLTPNKTSYTCGEAVNVRAVPAQGWQFNGWGGDLSGSVNPATLTVQGSHFIVANFVSGSNLPPVFGPLGDQTVFVGRQLRFTVRATDPEGAVTPTLLAQNLPSGAQFSDGGGGSGTFTWTPGANQVGNHDVTFVASDGNSQSSLTVRIQVVQPGASVFLPIVRKAN
jgi:regulation of enolase protein 1 (concanavalin A-like superfamily)